MSYLSILSLVLASAITPASALAAEDCVPFNTATTTVQFVGGEWKVVDGGHWMFSFGANKAEAEAALKVIKTYKFAQSCFVGRPDASMFYQLQATGAAAVGDLITGEDCIAFNTANTAVQFFPNLNTYKVVDGNMWMLDFGMNQQEANDSLAIIKKYGFNRQCYVGRPAPSFQYWKVVRPAPVQKPDLGAYGFLTIGVQKKLVKWNETIVLNKADATGFSGGVPFFELYYADKNYGTATATGYENQWKLGGNLVSRQFNRTLAAGQKSDIHTQAYLKLTPGVAQVLSLKVDALGSVAESREDNNDFQVNVIFR